MKYARFKILAILIVITIPYNCLFAQCDTSNVCTPKEVLSYLYEQNVVANQLKSDTSHLRSLLKDKSELIIQKDSMISNRESKIISEQKKNELIGIEKKSAEDSNKKLIRKNSALSILFIVSNVLKSLCIGYTLLH